MPRGDGTGPGGMGPMTGGGRGFCGGTNSPRRSFGFGCRLGRGGSGRGLQSRFYAADLMRREKLQPVNSAMSREEEASILKDRAETLSQQLESVHKRISELDSEKT